MGERKEGPQVATTGRELASQICRELVSAANHSFVTSCKKNPVKVFLFVKGVLLIFLNLSTVFSLSYLETVAAALSKNT